LERLLSDGVNADHTSHGHRHGTTFAFNITDAVQRLNANNMLGATANAITIIPTGTAGAGAEPIIGQVAIVEA